MIDMRRHLLAGQALSGSCRAPPAIRISSSRQLQIVRQASAQAGWLSPRSVNRAGKGQADEIRLLFPPAAVEPTHAAAYYLNF